jgi:hypothetical protein
MKELASSNKGHPANPTAVEGDSDSDGDGDGDSDGESTYPTQSTEPDAKYCNDVLTRGVLFLLTLIHTMLILMTLIHIVLILMTLATIGLWTLKPGSYDM